MKNGNFQLARGYSVGLLGFLFLMGTCFGTDVWKVPKIKSKKKNPIPKTEKAIDNGKIQYETLCLVCHGKSGAGDGQAAQGLNPKPADLGSSTIQSQSDGALFFKISKGRTPMPAFESVSKDTRWNIIHYLRTLKKGEN